MSDLDRIGREHAAVVLAAVEGTERPPLARPVMQPRRRIRVIMVAAVAAATVVVAALPLVFLRGGSDQSPDGRPVAVATPGGEGSLLGSGVTMATEDASAAATTTVPPTTAAPTIAAESEPGTSALFDFDGFLEMGLAGFFETDGEAAAIVLVRSDASLLIDRVVDDLPELDGYEFIPPDVVTMSAALYAAENESGALEGEWTGYALVPRYGDSPVETWLDRIGEQPGVVARLVPFEVPPAALPDGWMELSVVPSGDLNRALFEVTEVGPVVISNERTLALREDGAWIEGAGTPIRIDPNCCGGAHAAAAGTEVVILDQRSTAVSILDVETMQWRQADDMPQGLPVGADRVPLGTVYADGQLYVVLAAPRAAGADTPAFVLDLASGTWRDIGPLPSTVNVGGVTHDGARLLVAGVAQGPNNNILNSRNPWVFAYTDSSGWESLPPIPIDGQASTIVWVSGVGLLGWNYGLESAVLETGGQWEQLGGVPMGTQECYPRSAQTASGAVARCGGLALFDASSTSWRSIPFAYFDSAQYAVAADAVLGFIRTGRDTFKLIEYPLNER